MAQLENIGGYLAFAIAAFFLLICIAAVIQRWMTDRYDAGVHIVPTVFAAIGTALAGWPWWPFLIVVALDVMTFFANVRTREQS